MSFADVRKEIFDAAKESGKKTFSETAFNKLTSAMVNEPDYKVNVTKKSAGEVVDTETTPIADFRKSVIGGIAKSAGADGAEVEKLVSEYQFDSNTPWYPVVSEAITNYTDAGKTFTTIPKRDLNASFIMENVAETVKMVGVPGASEDEKKPVVYGAHRRLKCSSVCPKHLRKDK